MPKQVVLIGGPNGAGKTTAAMTLLPEFLALHEFVNADDIARGLNPLNPDGQAIMAGRLMIQRMDSLIKQEKNFAFESTCAGTQHLARLKHCKTLGYKFILIFLWLPSAEMAIKRVEQRIKSGGHSIDPKVIRRRYVKGLKNMVHHYLPLADDVLICDNSGTTHDNLSRIAEKSLGGRLEIHNSDIWKQITETANA